MITWVDKRIVPEMEGIIYDWTKVFEETHQLKLSTGWCVLLDRGDGSVVSIWPLEKWGTRETLD